MSATPLEEANLNAAFGSIMRRKQLRPEQVDRHGTEMHIFNTGAFQCPPCEHSWSSAFSWVTFDLKEMKIAKRWKMLCQCCRTAYFPNFERGQLEKMYEKAVEIYKRRLSGETPNVDIGYGARRQFRQPHLPELCEKCEWGRIPCFWRYCPFW